MEAAVQYHLHAPVHLRAGDMSLVDLARDAGMHPRLELLSGEVSPVERDAPSHEPRHQ
jgi:hypothetical protein